MLCMYVCMYITIPGIHAYIHTYIYVYAYIITGSPLVCPHGSLQVRSSPLQVRGATTTTATTAIDHSTCPGLRLATIRSTSTTTTTATATTPPGPERGTPQGVAAQVVVAADGVIRHGVPRTRPGQRVSCAHIHIHTHIYTHIYTLPYIYTYTYIHIHIVCGYSPR
jgi:hypothetical protein